MIVIVWRCDVCCRVASVETDLCLSLSMGADVVHCAINSIRYERTMPFFRSTAPHGTAHIHSTHIYLTFNFFFLFFSFLAFSFFTCAPFCHHRMDPKWKKKLQAESALMFDSVYVFVAGLTAMGRNYAMRPANLSCELEQPWQDGIQLYNHINAVSKLFCI